MNWKLSTLIALALTSTLYAANPADLTVFERFSDKTYFKGIYTDSKQTGFVQLPAFSDFVVSIQADRGEDDYGKLTGRFIKRIAPYFDATLIMDSTSKMGASDNTARLALDLHGEILGMPAGIGLYLPFDEYENLKVGPRISPVKNVTLFTTLIEEGNYFLGASYCTKEHKVEAAYSSSEAWYFRASKCFKADTVTIWPEIRLDVLPEDEIVGFGLGIFF